MAQWVLKVKDFPRKNKFPFRVEQIYYCKATTIPISLRHWQNLEICLRLSSHSDYTEDIINGELLKMPCPNILLRRPGITWTLPHTDIRDVISFTYSPDVIEKFDMQGMNLRHYGWSFAMTSELERLIAKFWLTVNSLYTPGAADTLDWICFSILGTLILQENMPDDQRTIENRIRNISIWFRTHFAEKIDIDSIAATYGISHDHFYKMWKKHFDMTPSQYINHLRLEAAARRLCETDIAISEIVKEVHFAGEYMFYKRFKEKYGMTPLEYRKRHSSKNL